MIVNTHLDQILEFTVVAERGENQRGCQDLQKRLYSGQQGKVHE